MYKLSRYNVIFKRFNKHYLWNTFSDALIELDDNAYHYIKNYKGNYVDDSYFLTLKENGCIIDEQFDELGKILFDEKYLMTNCFLKHISLTIAPGLECNYKCKYCFESQRTSFQKMTTEVQKQVYQYICSIIDKNKALKSINVTWFGGEPLLYTKIIYDISMKIIDVCNKNNIKYNAGIITNGRFLTKENIELLLKCRIKKVQLSIDGMKEHYIAQKNATEEDFKQTISNTLYASDYLPITVRINVSNELNEAIKLTDYLLLEKNLDGKIKIYLGYKRRYEKNLSLKEERKTYGEFLDIEKKYIKLFGINGKYKSESFAYLPPIRRGTTCLAVCHGNSCIGPEGELYKCEHHFGISEKIIGYIQKGYFYNDAKFYTFNHQRKCLNCKFFPVCLGGCLDDNINKINIINCKKYCLHLIDLKMFEFEY